MDGYFIGLIVGDWSSGWTLNTILNCSKPWHILVKIANFQNWCKNVALVFVKLVLKINEFLNPIMYLLWTSNLEDMLCSIFSIPAIPFVELNFLSTCTFVSRPIICFNRSLMTLTIVYTIPALQLLCVFE